MYEEYYAPLPDVDAYLARIGMSRPKSLSKEYLDDLVLAHQCSIVFENLDVCKYDRPIELSTERLFDKIVTRGRGGYCFELNGLFVKLLQALGYDAYSCPCRILRPDTMTSPGPVLHRGNAVRLDGKHLFCDVGYGGPMPPGALYFEDEHRQVVDGETYWFTRRDEFWWMLSRLTKGAGDSMIRNPNDPNETAVHEHNFMLISPASWAPTDFIAPNNSCSKEPTAIFRKSITVNQRRPDGYKSLSGNVFTVLKDGVRTRRELCDDEVTQILKDEFNITSEQ
jgi:N-hydroxyarylamine O-acetyltransferase